MESDLEKLRIDESQKARKDDRSIWPWLVVVLLLLIGGIGFWQWQSASAAPAVQTIRVRVPDGTAIASDRVLLNATGYVMAAHKIELASKVVGRVAWVGVEMGDKIKKDQKLVQLEDDEYRARAAQAQGQLDSAQAKLDELEAGSRPEEIA
jgi:HlyD family secretion protein